MAIFNYFNPTTGEEVLPISLIPNLLEFTYVENRGASFGMMQGAGALFIGITVVMSVAFLVFFYRTKEKTNFFFKYFTLAIVAGGIGNLIDRVTLGYVIDFVHVLFFPYVFNVADMLVVTGSVALAIYLFFYYDKKPKKKEVLSGKD